MTGETNKKSREKSQGKKIDWIKIKRFLKSKKFGMILSLIQLIISIIFLAELLYLNVLPIKYFLPLTFIILLFVAYTFLSQQSRKFKTMGKVISVLFTIMFSIGIYYLAWANGMLDGIGGADTKIDYISVYVLKDDKAETLNDTKDYNFGILKVLDRDLVDKTVSEMESKLDVNELSITEYDSWPEMIDALYDGSLDAVILNEVKVPMIIEEDNYKTFEDDTKIIYTYEIKTKINNKGNIDVTSNTFCIYISGIDVAGKISTTSRSDVNILAVVNPDTKQILLVNTPRDYYVNLALDKVGNPMDKLTHAGTYGIDVSMATLENFYGIDVNFFFRINFTGFEKVVNTLGGIDINSDFEFTTTHGGYYIKKGTNTLNGSQALGYSRERYAFASGDNQRGKNQMAVITSVIKKIASPAILNNFSGLMSDLQGSFETSMTSSQISSIVRMQLDEGGSWNVVNYAVTGKGSEDYCYALGSKNYVMVPDMTTVENAKTLMQMVFDGKTVSLDAIGE